MPMQTIACISISKIKVQIVAVELFQVENFFHQNDSRFALKSMQFFLTVSLQFFHGKPHWTEHNHRIKYVQDEKIRAFLYWGATLHNLQVVLLEVLSEILV